MNDGERTSSQVAQAKIQGVNGPAASVLMPVCNAGKYLDAAIESILGQSFTDFELLLLNDGSSDGSLDRMEHYAHLDSRCKVYSWPNRGIADTRNEGIRLARAEILIWMDADDISYPTRIEKQMAYLGGHTECVAVGTEVMLIDPDGEPLRHYVTQNDHDAIDAAHFDGRWGAILQPSSAMRKAAIVAVGGYRTNFPYAEDSDLWLRLAEVGRLANLPEVLFGYRQHLDATGYAHAQTQFDSQHRAIAEARVRRKLANSLSVDDWEPLPPVTVADVHRKWGWWALSERHFATARKHAFAAIRVGSFSIANLKLLACILRKH